MLNDYEKVMKAAADPTRARILKMLEGGEMCVCQVIAVLGISQSTVSQHLSLLKGAGLVRERRQQKFIHYSLERAPSPEMARAFLACLRRWLKNDPAILEDIQRAKVARREVSSMSDLVCGPLCCTPRIKGAAKAKAIAVRGREKRRKGGKAGA